MTSPSLVRLGGLAAIASGVVYIVFYLPMMAYVLAEKSFGEELWLTLTTLALVSVILALFGLVGLYGRQANTAGKLGLLGFLVTFVGVALWAGYSFALSYTPTESLLSIQNTRGAGSVSDLHAPTQYTRDIGTVSYLLAPVQKPGDYIDASWLHPSGLILAVMGTAIGWMLLGLAIIRARLYSRWQLAV